MKQKKLLGSILLIFSIAMGFADMKNPYRNMTQNSTWNDITSPRNGDYLTPVYNCIQNRENILKEVPKDLYYQILASNYSYVGDYRNALRSWDMQADTNHTTLTKEEENHIGRCDIRDAGKVILEQSSKQKIVMFNEAHHVPLHRAFVASLLRELKDQGYHYLAMETLSAGDIDKLNERKYATQVSGTYSVEPVFAAFIAAALQLNFTLVAYEAKVHCSEAPLECRKKREEEQAENISRIFEQDPEAKVVVFAGYDHINENGSTFKMMAELFKTKTKIDPLTIDLVGLTEKSSTAYEDSHYRYILERFSVDGPKVLLQDSDPQSFTKSKKGIVDFQVIFPRTEYKNGRPLWLNWIAPKKEIYIPELKQGHETRRWLLLQAFKGNSYDKNLIPADQVMFHPLAENIHDPLLLSRGKYLIRVAGLNNEEVFVKEISVD